MTFRFVLSAFALALIVAVAPAYAAGLGSTSSSSSSSSSSASTSTAVPTDFDRGKKAAEAGDYKTAIQYLTKAVEANPRDADAQNLLGFSYRKLGDAEAALRHYHAALAIDPRHRGTLEYMGELYLEQGELDKAEANLGKLGKACWYACPEYKDLKAAIKSYKSNG